MATRLPSQQPCTQMADSFEPRERSSDRTAIGSSPIERSNCTTRWHIDQQIAFINIPEKVDATVMNRADLRDRACFVENKKRRASECSDAIGCAIPGCLLKVTAT